MPFAAKYNESDDPNKKNQNGVNISGSSTSFSSNLPGQAAQGASGQKSSGAYANIQSYLDANSDQAEGMGQKIAGDVSSKADEAKQSIQGFESKAPKVNTYDPNEAFSKLGSLSDQEKQAYRDYRSTGGYSGPDSVDKVEGYAETTKKANEASNLVKATQNESGQQELLKSTYGRPSYSAGENRLDQALIQGSQGSRQALEQVGQKYKDLDSMFASANQKVGDAVTNANKQALLNKQNVLNAETQQWDSLLNPIKERANQANINNPKLIQQTQADITDDLLTPETMALLGLNEGQNLYRTNLSSYLTPNYSQVGLDNVANQSERQKYQALADLIGDQSRTEISQNGAQINPVNFNRAQFDADLAAQQAEYNKFADTYTGGFYDWANANDARMVGRNGEVLGIPGGTFGAGINNLTLNQLQNYLNDVNSGKTSLLGPEQAYIQNYVPKYIDYLKNQYGVNRTVKKG